MRIDCLLARGARLFPDVPAVIDAQASLSHAALHAEVGRIAACLRQHGVTRGDRVAVLSRNRWEHVALLHAAARLDAVIVPLNWRLSADELGWILQDADPCVVVAEPAFIATVDAQRAHSPDVRLWLALDEVPEGWRGWSEAMAAQSPEPVSALHDPTDVHAVLAQIYTSGTTGRPKGALLTHANVMASVAAISVDFGMKPGQDRHLQVTPLFHVGGLLMTVLCAASCVTLRLLPEFAPAAAARCLSQEPVTHTLMVPAMLQWLLSERGVEARSFAHLRFVAYGAAPMPESLLVQAIDTLGCEFFQGYGLTETSAMLTILSPQDHRDALASGRGERLASAGREMLGVELRVVDRQGRDVPAGQPGEVLARGACVSPGYWRRPEATAESHADGWFRTGDIGVMDEQRYLSIVDRAKDMLIVGGENVYPSEVERVLRNHPRVADCAVIGIPHAMWGEEVLALVVLQPGDEVDARVLIAHCRASLARYKCPTKVEWVGQIPRNAAGKIEKVKLREPHWAGRRRVV